MLEIIGYNLRVWCRIRNRRQDRTKLAGNWESQEGHPQMYHKGCAHSCERSLYCLCAYEETLRRDFSSVRLLMIWDAGYTKTDHRYSCFPHLHFVTSPNPLDLLLPLLPLLLFPSSPSPLVLLPLPSPSLLPFIFFSPSSSGAFSCFC